MGYCIAESPGASPWEQFHKPRHVDAPRGAVTVFACEGPQIVNFWGITTAANAHVGRQWLEMIADQMCARGNSNTHTMGEILVAVSPATARTLAAEGWTRETTQEF